MKVKELVAMFKNADSEADVFVSVVIGDNIFDIGVDAITDLDYAVFIEPEVLHIGVKKENA